MDRTYISWTIENWITVVLMVSLGYLLVALIYKGLGMSGNMNIAGLFGSSSVGNAGRMRGNATPNTAMI